jgi:hypothetical protein
MFRRAGPHCFRPCSRGPANIFSGRTESGSTSRSRPRAGSSTSTVDPRETTSPWPTATSPGRRPASNWGLFDADPQTPGIQPETDPATYNGSIWELASSLFLPGGPSTPPSDPGYQRAIEYYSARGYSTEFLWDWTGTGGAQAEYGDIISESDSRYRQATNVLGVIIANHVVSSVDAYLSARGVPTPTEVRFASVRAPDGQMSWTADVRLALGR